MEKALPVRFEGLRLEKNSTGVGGPEEERSRSSRGTQEERPATSTPVGSDREQRRKRSPEGISGIRDVHLPPPPPHRGGKCLLGGPVPGECIPAPQNLQRMNMTVIQGGVGGGRWKEDPIPPDQGNWTRGTTEKSGIGAGRRVRETESLLVFAERPPEARPTQVIIERKGVHGLAEGRE